MDIRIVDDFLPPTILYDAVDFINDSKWSLKVTSTPSSPRTFWGIDLSEDELFTKTIFEKINESFGMKFELLRVMANGHMQGSDGSYHRDDVDDCTYTFLLYLSDINEYNVDEIGGHTLFRDSNDKKIIAVEPLLNRGVLFDSKLEHRGLSPYRTSDVFRIAVAYKLKSI